MKQTPESTAWSTCPAAGTRKEIEPTLRKYQSFDEMKVDTPRRSRDRCKDRAQGLFISRDDLIASKLAARSQGTLLPLRRFEQQPEALKTKP